MRQPCCDPLTDGLGLAVILGVIAGHVVQVEDLAPLSALIQCCEKLVDGVCVHLNKRLLSATCLIDLCHGSNSNGNHQGIGVTRKVSQTSRKPYNDSQSIKNSLVIKTVGQ